MATNTPILGLTKPAYTDDADVAVINSNSDLLDAEAGRTRANFAAEYSTSSAYAVGAFCTHAGILYQCNTAIGSGGEAWTAAHWTQISAGDAVTSCNQAIAGKTDYKSISVSSYNLYDAANCAGVKAVIEAVPNNFTGVVRASFANSIVGACYVEKFNNNYASIFVIPDSGGDAVYGQCSNGTWKQGNVALNNTTVESLSVDQVSGTVKLVRNGKLRQLVFDDAKIPSQTYFSMPTLSASDCPATLTATYINSTYNVWIRTNGTFGQGGGTSGMLVNGNLMWIVAYKLTRIRESDYEQIM